MPGSPDDYRDRRRRSPSDSPARDGGRRRRGSEEKEYSRSSRRRDEHRSSRRDSSRRRSSRSPSGRGSHRRDRDHRRRERKEDGDDRRRSRYPSEERSHRRRRDRDARDDRHRTSHRPRSTSRSRSPARRRSRSPSSRAVQRKGPLPSQNDAFTSSEVTRTGEPSERPPVEKQKPNFGNSGRLAAESNTVDVNGGSVVLKYHEPGEARKPPSKEPWRLYVFKGNDLLEVVELHERSCWLIGKERLVVDFPLDHPSCSKQHAVIQFRHVERRNEFGDRIGRVKPYLLDLESANGSSVNGEAIPAGRYVEVQNKDVLRFGLSTREYVMILPPPESK